MRRTALRPRHPYLWGPRRGVVQEVEVKVRLAEGDGKALRRRLRGSGATLLGAGPEHDTFWRHAAGLPPRDGTLRVRAARDRFELTFKGPRAPGSVKIRDEINIECAQDPAAVLEALGFMVAARVSKDRESWRLGDVTVTIDAVEGVGEFAEVEALAHDAGATPDATSGGTPDAKRDATQEATRDKTQGSTQQATRAVEGALARLGLDDRPRVQEAYVQLALGTRQDAGDIA
jgi:adenylate cyclase class 2